MTIEEALNAHLTADPKIAAIVGSRVIPAQWEQGTEFPLITYTRISTKEGYTHDGWDGTEDIRLQITAWSNGSFGEALDLGVAIRASMRYFPRTPRLVTNRNTVEPQTSYHQFIQDWMVLWCESDS